MSYVDYEAQAADYRRDVSRDYYRARKYAKNAAREYKQAAFFLRHARWLTERPDLCDAECNAANFESYARTTLRLADTLLNSSFGYTERARFHAGLARQYDDLAARSRARLAGV